MNVMALGAGHGKTTMIVKRLLEEPSYVLLVLNIREKIMISNKHKELKGRIFTHDEVIHGNVHFTDLKDSTVLIDNADVLIQKVLKFPIKIDTITITGERNFCHNEGQK